MTSTKVLTTINDVDPAAWNAIVGRNRLVCRHEYLRAVEASRINDCRFFYPVVYDGNDIVAHACLYFISTELDVFAQGAAKQAIDRVRRVWKNFLILRSVECGTPVALGSTISYREGSDNLALTMEIVRETERLARWMGVGVILFRDFYDQELTFYDALRHAGYKRINNLSSARMTVQWRSFDEYLRSMRSSYRHKVESRMRKFKNGGCTIEHVEDFSRYAPDLARLWKNAYDHATEYRREILLEDFFRNMDKGLGRRSSVLAARNGEDLVGFALLLHDDTTLDWIFCGLDYTCNRQHDVYFNLLYAIVDLAIKGDFKDIDLGITTLIPKMDIGGAVTSLHMYMKHLRPVLNLFVPALFGIMTPVQSFSPRKVFKT